MGIIFIGMDPGKAGALAAIEEDGTKMNIEYTMMPLLASGEINGKAIYNFLAPYQNKKAFCVLELAQAMPQQGVVSVFNYGRGFGKLQSALEIMEIPFEEVRPMKWKKEFSLLKTEKSGSVALAQKLFPSVSFYTPRGRMLDGLAEALLMAEYGRRHYAKSGVI